MLILTTAAWAASRGMFGLHDELGALYATYPGDAAH